MSKKWVKKLKNKKTLLRIALVAGLLVVAVGLGVGAQFLQKSLTTQQKPSGDASEGPSLPSSVTDAQNLSAQGKTDEANKTIEAALQQNPDNDTKYELYIQQGLNLQNQGKHAEAIDYYRKAEAVRADYKVVRLIGDAAAMTGNKTLAIEYYKKAIPLISPDSPVKDSEKQRLEDKIKQLEG